MAECVRAGVTVESEIYIGFLISMFLAMRDIYQVKSAIVTTLSSLTGLQTDASGEYGDFCRNVYRLLLSHDALTSHPRLKDTISWGQATLRRDFDT